MKKTNPYLNGQKCDIGEIQSQKLYGFFQRTLEMFVSHDAYYQLLCSHPCHIGFAHFLNATKQCNFCVAETIGGEYIRPRGDGVPTTSTMKNYFLSLVWRRPPQCTWKWNEKYKSVHTAGVEKKSTTHGCVSFSFYHSVANKYKSRANSLQWDFLSINF